MQTETAGVVPPPWTPIEIGDHSVACWNRVYEFRDGLLPSRITSGGVELLAAPMRLAVKTDPRPAYAWSGVDEEWQAARLTVQHAAPDVVEFTTEAESQNLAAQCKYRFEFDGMLLCELLIEPRGKPVLARRIDLVMPLEPRQIGLFHHNPIKPIAQWDLDHDPFNSGAVPAAGLFLPFTHLLWLGNEQRGLQWFAESDQGLSPLGYFFSLDQDRKLTLNLTGLRTLTREKPFRFVFGLMASPVKPMRPTDEIRWSWQIIGDESLKKDCPDPLPRLKQSRDAGVNASFAVNITPLVQRSRTDRDFRQAWQRLNRAAEAADIALQACISWVTMKAGDPGSPQGITDDWLMQPELAMEFPEGLIHYPCVHGGFQDWFLATTEEGFRKLGLRGMYLDGPGVAVQCTNRAHGCGYEDERGLHPTLPILAARSLMKRLYLISRAGPKPGLIVAHMSGFMHLPSLSFADATLGTEHIAGWYPDQNPRYTLAGFRAEVLGHQYGIPSLWLYKNKDRPTLYNALSLLHDLVPTSFDGTTVAFANAYREFGAFGAQWVGYWEAKRPVDTTAPGVKVSSYLRAGTGTLTTVANLGDATVTAGLVYDTGMLGIGKPGVVATVAASGATLKREGSADSVSLEPGGWALLRVAQQPGG
jgi:hypothetical protein